MMVEESGVTPEQVAKGEFGFTYTGRLLRVCERFGQDPLTWPTRAYEAPEVMVRQLLAYDSVRQAQERLELAE